MAQCAYLQDRFALLDVVGTTEGDIQNFKDSIGAENLRYSAAYFPALKTTLRFKYKTENITVDSYKIMTYSLRNPMGRVSQGRLPEWNEELDIFKKIKAAIDELTIELLPSGAVAGVYALVDSTRGVWKAPTNVSINNVMGVTRLLNDTENGTLNVDSITGKSINAIRNFTGKGTLIWGARTLDGNSNEWRYINVRRFFIMIEESIKRAMKTFVFEPNDANIWVIVRGMIENYLTILWRQGAMMGAKPSEAFFVKVGLGETMTSLDIQEGRMIVMIGAAAVRPAEFTIITIIQQMPVLET
jgi:phage tail sheath protein FI